MIGKFIRELYGSCVPYEFTGDQLLLFMLDPRVRLQVGIAFNGRRTIYDPITGSIVEDFELQESIYFIAYRLFPKEVELDDILESDTIDIEDSDFKVSDDYGYMYDQEKVEKHIKRLNY